MSGRTKLSVSEERLEGITRGPLPASRKIYRTGTLLPEVRVPVREIALTPTRMHQGAGWVETAVFDGCWVRSSALRAGTPEAAATHP